MNKFMEILTRNFWWKLLSFVIAMGLWVMVINMENPTETRSYTVPIALENQAAVEEAGYLVANMEELNTTKLILKVRGPRMSLERLSQEKGRIAAVADLSQALKGLDAGLTTTIPIEITLPSISGDAVELESKSLSALSVTLEQKQTRSLQVKVSVTGDAADGFVLSTPVVSPESVEVIGGVEEIAKVSYVEAQVEVQNLQEDTVFTAVPVAYDSAGAPVNGVHLNVETVEVALSADPTKEIAVQADLTGTLPASLRLESVTVTPSRLWVAGTKETLKNIDVLTLPAMDLSQVQEDMEKTFFLSALLPDGVRILDKNTASAVVKVKLADAQTDTYVLSEHAITADIRLAEGLNADYDIGNLMITLKGPAEIMTNLTSADLEATFALEGDTEGIFHVPLTLVLPDGVEAVGEYQVTVTVTATGQ